MGRTSMLLKFGVTLISVVLILLTYEPLVYSDQVPIPEFFGLYVVAGRKLIEIKPIEVIRKANQIGLAKSPQINVEDSEAYLISYMEGRSPKNLALAQLKFVEREIVEFVPPGGMRDPKFRYKKQPVDFNMWVLGKTIELKVAPVQDRQHMYRLVPATPLVSGVYALPAALFGKLKSTDIFGSALQAEDRLMAFGKDAYAFSVKISEYTQPTGVTSQVDQREARVGTQPEYKKEQGAKIETSQESITQAKNLYSKSQFQEAIKLLEEIRTQIPENQEARQILAKAYINHAYQQSQKGAINQEEAIEIYKKAYDLNPNQIEASCNIAVLHAKKGQIEEGVKWLEKAYPILIKSQNAKLLQAIKRDPDLNALKEWPGFARKFPELAR